jgi:Globin
VLVNPANPTNAETMLRDVEAATRAMGLQIQFVNANTSHEIDAAFATFGRERPDMLFVSGGPFLLSRRVQLALLAARQAIPASYGSREYALNNLDKLVPAVKALGARHSGYGVTAAHYGIVGEALLWTLERGLGEGFTPEVRSAWAKVYGVLAATMQAGRGSRQPVRCGVSAG